MCACQRAYALLKIDDFRWQLNELYCIDSHHLKTKVEWTQKNTTHNKYTACTMWILGEWHTKYIFSEEKISLIIIFIIIIVVSWSTPLSSFTVVLTIEGFNYFRIYSTNVKYTIRWTTYSYPKAPKEIVIHFCVYPSSAATLSLCTTVYSVCTCIAILLFGSATILYHFVDNSWLGYVALYVVSLSLALF